MKKVLLVLLVLLGIGGAYGWQKYAAVFNANVHVEEGEIDFVVADGAEFEEVVSQLDELQILEDLASFRWVAEKKSYPSRVRPGRYRIKDGMSNNELVNMLRAGAQLPVRFTFNNARNLEELAGKLGQGLAADSAAFLAVLKDKELMADYGFNEKTFIAMFVPNTYEMYWTISPEDFVVKMAGEFKNFWNEDRLAKARAIGLSQSEVVTLASIVQSEQSLHSSEWKTIAGLYLNRIRKNIPLQSDPTVIFAVGDFSIRRVLNKHLQHDSPYNTYIYNGIPPGPIRMPDIGAVDAVLNAEQHKYLFMCAKEDLSGYHYFARTLAEHSRYAARYRARMDRDRVYN